ncbi:thioredoxin family protein [Flammeovirga kamogawensis]|uniref:Thioredoxin family protein n=1 Tax=Flammeovirga kamogawensis TaxID=373891 RepID=A0ABX8H028_9BACT|nr:thioredoxin family protein [Flammeovirga kamogawensis]MBB6459207.1 thiol:disulfide interchange protein [Flammeovirga kamogawensis]QWG08772.1 thioredoxin family protein [Flammeovirga kamogawensis]TRX67062.1 thioredoxin family protein [Flammeovirga kamogawensis]
MKNLKLLISIIGIFISINAYSQTEVYDPSADAKAAIKEAVSLAKKSNKHVFVKVGGNWCGWCKLYAKFTHQDEEIMKVMNDNYVTVLVNWSKENKNEETMEYLGNPQRFGFPVFVILDSSGKVIHIQNSGNLESGKGYDKNKVMQFINGWTPTAVNPATYK